MQFSAFAPFGHFSFQGSDPIGKLLYEEKLRNIGAEQNFPNDENTRGKLYADAMLAASVRLTLDRALNQGRSLTTTDFLATHEFERGITPLPAQSDQQRRQALHAVRSARIDGLLSTIGQALKDLLGDDLVFYRTTAVDELPDRAGFDAVDTAHSLYPGWSTPIRIERITEHVTTINQLIRLKTEFVSGHVNYYSARQVVLVEPGSNSRAERVTLVDADISATGGTVLCRFTRPHDAGTLITSGHHPRQQSDKRRHHIVLRNGKAIDRNVRHSIDALMRRLVRGASVWQICEESETEGRTGPFILGQSNLGACTIAEVAA